LCALARHNGDVGTLEAINDLGINNPEITLEIKPLRSVERSLMNQKWSREAPLK
jgi:hypothetical protein